MYVIFLLDLLCKFNNNVPEKHEKFLRIYIKILRGKIPFMLKSKS